MSVVGIPDVLELEPSETGIVVELVIASVGDVEDVVALLVVVLVAFVSSAVDSLPSPDPSSVALDEPADALADALALALAGPGPLPNGLFPPSESHATENTLHARSAPAATRADLQLTFVDRTP